MSGRASILAVVAAALLVLYSSAIFVDETEHVIITQFGEYKRTISTPGLDFKLPFLQTSTVVEKRIQASDAIHEEYFTADKKRLVADPITRWRVGDAIEYYKKVRADGVRARATLDQIVKSELRQELGQRNMGDMVGNARGEMMAHVTERVSKKAQEYGILVVDVRIKRLDLPKEVQQSVFARMVAERERLAKKYRARGQERSDEITADTNRERDIILEEARKTAEVLRGQGDAEATEIYARAYGKDPEFYAFVRNLETYDKLVDKSSTVVLSTGSKLFHYMTEPGKAPKRAAE